MPEDDAGDVGAIYGFKASVWIDRCRDLLCADALSLPDKDGRDRRANKSQPRYFRRSHSFPPERDKIGEQLWHITKFCSRLGIPVPHSFRNAEKEHC